MSAHYAMCKYDDTTGSYIPLEVRPITDTLKKDDPLYQEGFQAGAASRDAEIAELKELIRLIFESTSPYREDGSYVFADAVIEKWKELRQ